MIDWLVVDYDNQEIKCSQLVGCVYVLKINRNRPVSPKKEGAAVGAKSSGG